MKNKKKTLAIITARGGSKRLPRKNIKPFLGKPIIVYSIKAALLSGCFNEVMVSTDDKKIAEIARQAGAKVPFFRSAATSSDTATLADVCLEVISEYKKMNKKFEYFCCLLPTAPFITSSRLKISYKRLKESQAATLVPVVKFSYPILRGLYLINRRLKMIWPENYAKRSQDLPAAYHDSGQFYWARVDKFIKIKKFFSGQALGLEIPEIEVQDIDTREDWKTAELKFRLLKNINK